MTTPTVIFFEGWVDGPICSCGNDVMYSGFEQELPDHPEKFTCLSCKAVFTLAGMPVTDGQVPEETKLTAIKAEES